MISVKAEPLRARNHSGQEMPEARQARWMGSGGGALSANASFIEASGVADIPERAGVVRRVVCRKSCRFWMEATVWVPDRASGRVKKTVAARREGEMLVEDMINCGMIDRR